MMRAARSLLAVFAGAALSVLAASCADGLPPGRYPSTSPESSYDALQQVMEALALAGRPARLDLYFWGFRTEAGLTYMTVFGESRTGRVYLHLLVRMEDAILARLRRGGYRHALLGGVERRSDRVGGVNEMIYLGVRDIVD